jgi:hypothetical protein
MAKRITVSGLNAYYGTVTAVADVDLAVEPPGVAAVRNRLSTPGRHAVDRARPADRPIRAGARLTEADHG